MLQGVHLARNNIYLTNGWHVDINVDPHVAVQLYTVNRTAWYQAGFSVGGACEHAPRGLATTESTVFCNLMQGRTAIPPNAADVAPFTALNRSTSGLLDDTAQMAVFRFKAWRFLWSGHLNSSLPIFAVAFLSMIVFWIPEDQLGSRIELCAALFLTLIGKSVLDSD